MKPLRILPIAAAIAAAFCVAITFSSCNKKSKFDIDPAFAQFISAFTSGSISVEGSIKIRLADSFVENITLNEPIQEDWIDFSPNIEGTLIWIDNQTLEFKPKEPLQRGETYEAEFALGKLIPVPSNLEEFNFSFSVLNQHADLEISSVQAYRNDDLRWMKMQGIVRTVDVTDNAKLEEILKADQGSGDLQISWAHSEDRRSHYFSIDSIERKETAQTVNYTWNSASIDADETGSGSQNIPALGDFKLMFSKVVQQPEQYIVLQFSDPLNPGQNLEGIIELSGYYGPRFVVENNEVRIYPPYRLAGEIEVYVYPGIRNIMGYSMSEQMNLKFTFEELKPNVEIPDPTRVILPSTDGLVLPFKAVNLTAVDVKMIRIYENNIPQFLQVNELDGSSELRRVGKKVAKKTIQLNTEEGKDLQQWNTFYLNLDQIIQSEPGAIYRVEISFKKAYSLYACEENEEEENENENLQSVVDEDEDAEEDESSYWDYYEDYYYYDSDWGEASNPCSNEYYQNKIIAKNILASDMGLIVKRGSNGSMHIYANDIKSTKGMSDVTIQVLNYQQQIIAQSKTDAVGNAVIEKINGSPFLVIAKRNSQYAYLKVDNNHSLSTSTFDVSGETTQKGLKGYIYGERGVWRPGDSLYLSFMLEDALKALPPSHPVTLEFVNPRGQVIQKITKTKGENGVYSFATKTENDAPTGNYLANVRVGGATFSKSLKIETIKPNRLKLALDFGREKITAIDANLTGILSAKWLHGAVAKNLKANVSATFSSASTAFKKYEDYVFDDPARNFYSEEQVIFNGSIDQQGIAQVPFIAALRGTAPGMVTANFTVKVFEEGGDFSVDRFNIPYAPYPVFVGMKPPKGDKERGMLLTDTEQTVEIVTVNSNGNALARQNLNWKVYKVEWRWWWEKSKDNFANYVSSSTTIPIASGSTSTNENGRGNFKFQVNYPDWGRYLIRIEDADGHATGQTVYIDWPGWAGRAQRENPNGATMLMFRTDKEKYSVGEECTISFPSSGLGRALISIEDGNKVLESYWVNAQKDNTVFKFRTTSDMAPNAYINITLLQPHSQTANDLPIRLYGVIPLFVENPDSHLQPVITMKDELAPEKEFEVKVSEKTGKPMTYTIAIVDEGLLDLTRFKTPDPWNHFYAREALGVNTFDMYDQVIGAFGFKVEKLLSIGGSDEGGGKANNKANRFKPVVIFSGPLTIGPNQTKTHKFTMPNYIGSVRVMVVARHEEAYGNAEKAVPVKKPLMVLATLPRVLGPGETVQLPVNVFAMDPQIKNVNVKIEPNEFLIASTDQANLKFAQPGDEVINFNLKVADKTGIGKVKVTVTSGSFKSTHEIEIDVRNPNPYITDVIASVVEPGQTWETTFDQIGMSGTNEVTLEVSTLFPIDFSRRMHYLLTYPHGCVEQTTSSAFPQLFLADVMDMDEKQKTRATQNIKAAITRIASFQNSSGGLGYWPGSGNADDWGTSYAGHFMLEAKAKGYSLPGNFESNWIKYQKHHAQNWRQQEAGSGNPYYMYSAQAQAYRLYTLALAGQPELGAMNRLKENKQLDVQTKWRLAAAYALVGQKEIATQLVNNLNSKIEKYVALSYSYGDERRDLAMILETLVILDQKTQAAPIANELAKYLNSNEWLSTQSTAYGLLSISKYVGKNPGKNIRYTYTLNGANSAEMNSSKPLSRTMLTAKMKGNSLKIKNTTTDKAQLFVRVVRTGQPLNMQESAAENNLKLSVEYLSIQGGSLDISRLEQGTDFYAKVTVTNPGTRGQLDELALTHIFPSGWEILNSRLESSAVVNNADQPEYVDYRDDRVLSYFDLYAGQTKTFYVKLNATYLGRFYMPGVNVEAMYDHTINARKKGQWIEVVNGSDPVASK